VGFGQLVDVEIDVENKRQIFTRSLQVYVEQ